MTQKLQNVTILDQAQIDMMGQAKDFPKGLEMVGLEDIVPEEFAIDAAKCHHIAVEFEGKQYLVLPGEQVPIHSSIAKEESGTMLATDFTKGG